MRLVQEATSNFIGTFMGFLNESGSIAERFHKVRQLYDIENISNDVVDGDISFPQDRQSLLSGISVEFRFVSQPQQTEIRSHAITGTSLSNIPVLRI